MSALLAYPLSIKKLPYRRAITFFVFFTMLFNGGLVPTYLMYVKYFHIKKHDLGIDCSGLPVKRKQRADDPKLL